MNWALPQKLATEEEGQQARKSEGPRIAVRVILETHKFSDQTSKEQCNTASNTEERVKVEVILLVYH